ncbi:hypothetical protein EGT51_02980 [Levilactobacillus suantsaiihabitans]|uniref:Uncharacterized protein n=1 Tax=Levilactobacillus suantsaiihabitans TaxID=2487722 RepID=A0A4Z0JAL5_9LACO|nr:hypothetical protein EGT51_02980 [Levilactobacillus suantsaiihabitans]
MLYWPPAVAVNMGWNAVGGPVEPKDGLALALSRKSRLKDASCLSGMNRAAKTTPTAEPIFTTTLGYDS